MCDGCEPAAGDSNPAVTDGMKEDEMRTVIFSICFLFFILPAQCLCAQTQTKDSNELEEYIAKIREWRMTESARMHLRSVASILSENTILSFSKDDASGAYWKSYGSASCPDPNMDPAELKRTREEYEARIAPIISTLRSLADTDESGFVTPEEAEQFRELVEFAYQASFVAEQAGAGSENFLTGMSMDKERFERRAEEYKSMYAKARESGLDLPEPSF
jgi:hypothetical protein